MTERTEPDDDAIDRTYPNEADWAVADDEATDGTPNLDHPDSLKYGEHGEHGEPAGGAPVSGDFCERTLARVRKDREIIANEAARWDRDQATRIPRALLDAYSVPEPTAGFVDSAEERIARDRDLARRLAKALAANPDHPRSLLGSFRVPEPSADFVERTWSRIADQDRLAGQDQLAPQDPVGNEPPIPIDAPWRELVEDFDAPRPTADFVERTLSALHASTGDATSTSRTSPSRTAPSAGRPAPRRRATARESQPPRTTRRWQVGLASAALVLASLGTWWLTDPSAPGQAPGNRLIEGVPGRAIDTIAAFAHPPRPGQTSSRLRVASTLASFATAPSRVTGSNPWTAWTDAIGD